MSPNTTIYAILAAALGGGTAFAQHRHASQVVIPQTGAFAFDRARTPRPIVVEAVRARVRIVEQAATTALEIVLRNPSARTEEAVLLVPVPERAAVRDFTFEGGAAEPTAEILPRDDARRSYDAIVRRLRDPALLEFAGCNLLRSSVFPVAPGATQRIHLTYDHLLEADGNRVDYSLPRSESLARGAAWDVTVRIESKARIGIVFSPSHGIRTVRRPGGRIAVRLADASAAEPGPFLLSYVLEREGGVAASLFAYPDPSVGGGYFLLLAGLPTPDAAARKRVRREVTIVLDRSGSMAGAKLGQARCAALRVIEELEEGEAFNIVDYATTPERFAARAVRRDGDSLAHASAYLASLHPGGGTNIHDALLEALRPKPLDGTLPIVLFLTDGLPTVGETSESAIREMVATGNLHQRRVFTFGVGHDVNVPLLDCVAEITRATTTYVGPGEHIETKVAQVFRKLYGPVLSSGELFALSESGAPEPRIRELEPRRLPDLFENDHLVVLGRYRGDEPIRFALRGDYRGERRTFEFGFSLDASTTRNAFVPRLWATRRIAFLIDQVRQAGAAHTAAVDPFADPRMREVRDRILELSTRFGVISEYTAFLATEGTRLSDWGEIASTCGQELSGKAIGTRSGIGAINQGANLSDQKARTRLNRRNAYLDERLERVEIGGVQQIADRAFFRRGNRWIDGSSVVAGELDADATITFGSDQHRELLRKLIGEGRNGVLSLKGEILVRIDGKNILVVNDR